MRHLRLVNLTGKKVVVSYYKKKHVFLPSDEYPMIEVDVTLVQRTEAKSENMIYPIFDEFLTISELPMKEKKVMYIVPTVVRNVYNKRKDFISPSGKVTEENNVIYCTGFVKN